MEPMEVLLLLAGTDIIKIMSYVLLWCHDE